MRSFARCAVSAPRRWLATADEMRVSRREQEHADPSAGVLLVPRCACLARRGLGCRLGRGHSRLEAASTSVSPARSPTDCARLSSACEGRRYRVRS